MDLNGDTLDDLVVGAPLFSESGDEGRAYVYINKEFVSLLMVYRESLYFFTEIFFSSFSELKNYYKKGIKNYKNYKTSEL